MIDDQPLACSGLDSPTRLFLLVQDGLGRARDLLVRDDDDGFSRVAARVHGEQGVAGVLEAREAVLTVNDLALEDERRDDLVAFGGVFCDLLRADDEASDGDATLEDFFEVLWYEREQMSIQIRLGTSKTYFLSQYFPRRCCWRRR